MITLNKKSNHIALYKVDILKSVVYTRNKQKMKEFNAILQ